ncbi:HAMP domain-containing histidine kinase [Sporosarcina sp. ANT_H38]|nr:HAMP domain-containing histidine kinase [Sporosarcina sp. ANT_H38]
MKSWILFFLLALGFVDTLIWLDAGIDTELSSVLYVNVLLLIAFTTFVIWRYRKEMRFSKELSNLAGEPSLDWQEAFPEPIFSRDKVAMEAMRLVAVSSLKEISELRYANLIESDYTAAWVHEVKAPLTAMKLTMDGHLHEPVIRKIQAEWLRVHLLIDQQLYISRMSTLEADYVLEKTDVHGMVTAEVRELASWCIEKNVAVEFEGESEEVITDVKWCRFIIRQIVTNAVKYSPIGGTIIISMSVNPTGNGILYIKDEGHGIEAHDLPRVFDKGFTGGAGRLYNAATGLGLYLAQTVADKIGITLHVQSEIGQGTTVQMTFSIENDFDKVLK